MLVLTDRGVDAVEFLTALSGTGAQLLGRLRATRRLPALARCADGTRYTANYRLATTWPTPAVPPR